MNRVIHKHACACPSCQRARFRLLRGGDRDITPFPRPAVSWWARVGCRLEDASGYALLLIAAASVFTTDAYLWLAFGPWLFATMAAACGSVAAARVRAVWPLLLALGCFLSAAFAAYVALGLFALAARVWTALMGVPA